MPVNEYWIHISVPVTGECAELIGNFLFEKGSCGLEEKADRIEAYFEPTDENRLIEDIRRYVSNFQYIKVNEISISRCPKSDWSLKWREFFKPVHLSQRLVIKPPWETVIAEKNQIVIDIMPRMAFGTGTHETTQLCLKMIEKSILPGMEVLDVGAGSSILSIAAARFGAEHVFGVEIEEEAVQNAVENIEQNRVSRQVSVTHGSLEKVPDQTFDLIAANINRAVLVQLIPGFLAFCKPGTILILSGILESEKESITDILEANHFECLDVQQQGEWLGFQVQKI